MLALKIAHPEKVFLLRGNHECGSVSGHFGFKDECKKKYGLNGKQFFSLLSAYLSHILFIVYYRTLLVFQTMPIAAIVGTAYGDIYACKYAMRDYFPFSLVCIGHGGLSPSLTTIEEIDSFDRFVEPESHVGLLDILWSDPICEDIIEEDQSNEAFEDFLKLQWKPNPTRGCSYVFGYSAVKEFLTKNGLVCIVRAHEVQSEGFRKHYDPKAIEDRYNQMLKNGANVNNDIITEREFPPVITIFSAPNYCDRYGNKAAILRIDSALDGLRVIQYDCVEHPIPDTSNCQTDNYMEAIIIACVYIYFSI